MPDPTSDETAGPGSAIQRWTEGWSRKAGGHAGPLTILFVLLEIVFVTAMVISGQEMCSEPNALGFSRCNPGIQAIFWMGVLASILGLFLIVVSWATWLAVRHHNKRARKLAEEFSRRLQSAKDWFVGGRIDATTLAALRGHYAPLASGEVRGANARLAGEILASFGAAIICFSPVVWLLAALGMVRGALEGFIVSLAVPIAIIGLGVALYVVGRRIRARGRVEGERAVSQALAADEAVLQSLRTRRTRSAVRA